MTELYFVEDEPFTDEQLSEIVALALKAGYRPLNGVPRSVRGKEPFLSFHLIARSDVPGIKNG